MLIILSIHLNSMPLIQRMERLWKRIYSCRSHPLHTVSFQMHFRITSKCQSCLLQHEMMNMLTPCAVLTEKRNICVSPVLLTRRIAQLSYTSTFTGLKECCVHSSACTKVGRTVPSCGRHSINPQCLELSREFIYL
jgi:hypothetical protein